MLGRESHGLESGAKQATVRLRRVCIRLANSLQNKGSCEAKFPFPLDDSTDSYIT